MFLLYIAIGVTQMTVFSGATAGEGMAAKLANMAQHATEVRINVVLGLITCFVALTLGVALYALTRAQDPNLAMLALICRVGEGLIGGMFMSLTLGLLALATAEGANAPDPAAAQTLGAFVLKARSWNPIIAATFFAVGSTLFCYLFLRARSIPVTLAWLGSAASILLVVALPLQLATILRGSVTYFVWIPMAVFEVVLALWLIIKGVATPAPGR
jgi:hypothetical protein